ncbi:NAD-P-binding protein [Mycena galericulata]|nr:NAD-P-binding protein [Mycena galericulata]
MSLPTFSSSTTAEEVASALASTIQGKNVLITGTSLTGIGFEVARTIAKYANRVIITGHNVERLKLSEEAIKKDVPTAHIRTFVLDLSSLAAVRKAAAEVNAEPEPLHVLIHNAAAIIGPFKLTADNLESQMATDHIGPFLLTALLAPKLLAAGKTDYVPRVVFVASIAHASGNGVDLSTISHPDPEKYTSFDGYFQAKSANVLTARELTKRAKGRINAYSLHPGVIYTNIHRNVETLADLKAAGVLNPDGTPSPALPWKTIPEGAAVILAAAFDPRLDATPGAYIVDCVESNKDVAPHSSDPVKAEQLWSVTEEIVGEKFTFEQ